MKIRRHSKDYNFVGDTESGITFRWGKTMKEDTAVAPWPELADISISNHCTKGCNFCYRDSMPNNTFMSLKDYEYILNELNHPKWGNVFQIALGGGEPFEHPQIKEIIDLTLRYNVIPNLTTNAIHLNTDTVRFLKGRIGAIAVSIDSFELYDFEKVRLLTSNAIKTNIHYILNKANIHEAIRILKGDYNHKISGINSIIFLTHKPSGRASSENNLIFDCHFQEFITLIDKKKTSTRIGFDACLVPVLLHLTNTRAEFIDSCECAFFSVYIDENLNVKPCSFASDDEYTFNLRDISFGIIWQEKYQEYRNGTINTCVRECSGKKHCRGECRYFDEINYCYSTIQEGALHV